MSPNISFSLSLSALIVNCVNVLAFHFVRYFLSHACLFACMYLYMSFYCFCLPVCLYIHIFVSVSVCVLVAIYLHVTHHPLFIPLSLSFLFTPSVFLYCISYSHFSHLYFSTSILNHLSDLMKSVILLPLYIHSSFHQCSSIHSSTHSLLTSLSPHLLNSCQHPISFFCPPSPVCPPPLQSLSSQTSHFLFYLESYSGCPAECPSLEEYEVRSLRVCYCFSRVSKRVVECNRTF